MKISTGVDLRPDLALKRSEKERARILAAAGEPGARQVVVAAFQMRNHCDGAAGKDANLQRMLDAIAAAKAQGVRMLAMPEMCLPGYFTWVAGNVEKGIADTHALTDRVEDSTFIAALREACRDAKMALAFGFAERDGGAVYNSIGLIDADGSWLGTRRKNPLYPWDYELKVFRQPDSEQRSAVFDTAYGRVGLANCFDGEFPESVRQMRLDGAEVLLWCNAPCGDPTHGTTSRFVEAGGHARANDMWVVCCCCVASNTTGSSLIFSPSGEPLVMLSPDEEELGVATIDLSLNKGWPMRRERVCKAVSRQTHL